jgi:hypothetical protein
MKTDKPFSKSFVCAAVLFAALVVWLVASGAHNISYRIGYTMSICSFPAVATGTWGWFSSKQWSWGRFIVTFVFMFILFGFLASSGNRAGR